MYWSAEEFVLVITALLFLAIVASSFLPGVELTPMSRATFAIGAVALLGAAAALARIEDARFPPVVWAIPAIPALIACVLVRDAFVRWPRRSLNRVAAPRRAGSTAHDSHLVTAAGAPRERAADPLASPQELESIAYAHPQARAVVAGNPAASANLLEWLAGTGDPAIHAAIGAREPAGTKTRPTSGRAA